MRNEVEERTGKMGRLSVGKKQVEQVCKNCREKYLANHIRITSVSRDLSGGWCLKCRTQARAEYDAAQEVVYQGQLAEKREAWRLKCGIPKKFMHDDFDTYDAKWSSKPNNFRQVLKQCREYADGFPIGAATYPPYHSFILFSPETQGVGKTHLAVAICHRVLDRWQGETHTCPVAFISEPDLYRSIQATFDYTVEEKRQLPSEQDMVNRLIRTPLLVLDDLGTEERFSKDFTNRILFAIINGRYENEVPIVITTNLDKAGMNRYFADAAGHVRIFDRLWEMCAGKFFLQVKGESYRRREIK